MNTSYTLPQKPLTCCLKLSSVNQELPGLNSPAATMETSTLLDLNSCLMQEAKLSTAAWVAHWIPRTGEGTLLKPDVRKMILPLEIRMSGSIIWVKRAAPEIILYTLKLFDLHNICSTYPKD